MYNTVCPDEPSYNKAFYDSIAQIAKELNQPVPDISASPENTDCWHCSECGEKIEPFTEIFTDNGIILCADCGRKHYEKENANDE